MNLSELIKACGDKFGYLQLDKRKAWIAWSDGPEIQVHNNNFYGMGKTPEEAVFNLYEKIK